MVTAEKRAFAVELVSLQIWSVLFTMFICVLFFVFLLTSPSKSEVTSQPKEMKNKKVVVARNAPSVQVKQIVFSESAPELQILSQDGLELQKRDCTPVISKNVSSSKNIRRRRLHCRPEQR